MELRKFLGLVNFYRHSLPHAAESQAPLHQYLHESRRNDKRRIVWTREAEEAFDQIKKNLANANLLAHLAVGLKTGLVTDASDFGMRASLEQFMDDSWKPLAFFSTKFSSSQLNYSAYDRELTANYEAIRHFKYFLGGQIFKVVTDHKPLITILLLLNSWCLMVDSSTYTLTSWVRSRTAMVTGIVS